MDIRELAIRAGFDVLETGNEFILVSDPGSDAIVRFAALVQAAEREACAALRSEDEMERCKTCKHWQAPTPDDSHHVDQICSPLDPDTMKPMKRGFESRLCNHPSQAFFEAPVQANSFSLTDASEYMAYLATGEDFGCVLHEQA